VRACTLEALPRDSVDPLAIGTMTLRAGDVVDARRVQSFVNDLQLDSNENSSKRKRLVTSTCISRSLR